MKDKGIINYEFALTGIDTFVLDFELLATGEIVTKIFKATKDALKKKDKEKNYDFLDNPAGIERVNISPAYYNVIKTSIKKYIKKVIREVAKDNIIVLKYSVVKAYYEKAKEDKDYKLIVRVGGLYIDKRFT